MDHAATAWWRHLAPTVNWSRYENGGFLLLEGSIGAQAVVVILDDHPQSSIKKRDIDESELLEILALPLSSHGTGKKPTRREVAGRIGMKKLRVIYRWIADAAVEVVTAYWE